VIEGASVHELPAECPPTLVPGRHVELPGRGSIFVRELEGPSGAPTLLLLHGFIASGGLNWQHAFAPLGEHFRVIAPDLRGHGRGLRSLRSSFSFDACADDLAALLEVRGIESAIAVGYSMGGPIAKILWRRHPALVAGLVLCATSPCTAWGGRITNALAPSALSAFAATARVSQLARTVSIAMRRRLLDWASEPDEPHTRWALLEMSRHDPRMLVEAAAELQRFDALDWYRTIDVPTACIITTRDTAIPPESQVLSALYIRDSKVYCVDVGHVAHAHPMFLRSLVTACRDVASRAAAATPPARRARIRRGVEAHLDSILT
jgi:pimeloyl-ACP methyl ester carboxylesterase